MSPLSTRASGGRDISGSSDASDRVSQMPIPDADGSWGYPAWVPGGALVRMLYRVLTWHRPHPGWLVASPVVRGHRVGPLSWWWVNADPTESVVPLRGIRVAAGWDGWRLLALDAAADIQPWPRWLVLTRSSHPEAWHRLLCSCRMAQLRGVETASTRALGVGG